MGSLLLMDLGDEKAVKCTLPPQKNVTKSLTVTPSKESVEFEFEETGGKENRRAHVTVKSDEFIVLQKLIRFAIPYMYGWQHLAQPIMDCNLNPHNQHISISRTL
eukprot:TRINITY_DN9842_c0_g9_i1.p1 TRINITY_DN9842_c0_g9~~TRINITY_DN9842_c0_g9_i1.p1  ORF type:complete len:105 (-),score=2.67 TRINITY_DN9842_c0_g9_i1:94-408(-)